MWETLYYFCTQSWKYLMCAFASSLWLALHFEKYMICGFVLRLPLCCQS
jgi:hypothetical protein